MEIRTNVSGFNPHVTKPAFALPTRSCDTHMHILGPFDRFPLRVTKNLNPPEAALCDYRKVQIETGLSRFLVVQASSYGNDNSCALDAVARGNGNGRAVVAIDPDISDEELRSLHNAGARGVRLHNIVAGGVGLDKLEAIADRIRPLGWHVQLYVDASSLVELEPRVQKLDIPVVFDHMAHIDATSTLNDPGYAVLKRLLRSGAAWVKLSNALFPASGERATDLFKANPERVMWGSDWPHVAFSSGPTPDDGVLLNALADWLPKDRDREQVLALNPAALYFS